MAKKIFITDSEMKDFKKWLKENNKVDNKIALAEYLAEVKKDKVAIECFKRIKDGTIKEENLIIEELEEDDPFDDISEYQIEGMKMIFEGCKRIAESKDEIDIFKGLSESCLKAMFSTIMIKHSDELLRISKDMMVMSRLSRAVDKLFGDDESDKDSKDKE